MRTDCPKCESENAWYEVDRNDIWLRCRCGYAKVVFSKQDKGITIIRRESESVLKLPKKSGKLWHTIMVLSVLAPANSAEITERLRDLGKDMTVSDVSSYLTMLRTKGLVRTLENRRGALGGSTWELTETCQTLVGD